MTGQPPIGLTEGYLAAMAAHDPAKAPVSTTVRFTENTHVTKLGEGDARTNVTALRGYKIYVDLDTPSGWGE